METQIILQIKYYNEGIDEILICDVVASLYNRKSIFKIINSIAKNIFVPILLFGGGIRSTKDAKVTFKKWSR